jgi:membrane protein required for colicin V production
MSQYIQPYDLLMLAVLVVCILHGVWRGMVWEVATLASVFLSAAVAMSGCAALAPCFDVPEPWNRVLAMLTLYLVTATAIWLLFQLISRVIERLRLKEFDRQLGAIAGLVKGGIYCVLITFFAVTLSEPARQVILVSRSGGYIARAIHQANAILPVDLRAVLGKYIDELDQKLHAPAKPSRQPAQMLLPTSDVDQPPDRAGDGNGVPRAVSEPTGAGG